MKRKATRLSNIKSLKVMKNVVDFKFLKWILHFNFPSKIKNLLDNPVFLNWVNVVKEVSTAICSGNSKNL